MLREGRVRTCSALFAIVSGLIGLSSAASAQPCDPDNPSNLLIGADGVLDCEALGLLDLDGDGVPDLLQALGRRGIARFQLDNVNDNLTPGIDGFRDAVLTDSVVPDCATCVDGNGRARSPLSTGTLSVVYLPDSDGNVDILDPTSDDSLLYVGFDIANGDARRVGDAGGTPNVDFHDIDYVLDPNIPETLCSAGWPAPGGTLLWLMPPFDMDGNGRVNNPVTRFTEEGDPNCVAGDFGPLADEGLEGYRFIFSICASPTFDPDIQPLATPVFEVGVRMFRASGSGDAVFLSSQEFSGADLSLAEISTFPTVGMTAAQLEALPPRNLDVEFVIRRVDSVAHSIDPGMPFAITRAKIARGEIFSFSGGEEDASEEDRVRFFYDLPLPDIEVTKQVRCVDPNDPNTPYSDSVQALPGSQVQFKIEVENTGNATVAVDLADTLAAVAPAMVVDPASLEVTVFRAGGAVGTVINAANAIAEGFNDQFFVGPDRFLANLDGTIACLGRLNGIQGCATPATLGDRVVITFTARVESPECDPNSTVDVTNSITALGDIDISGNCGLAGGNLADYEAVDAFGVIDSAREFAQGFDDNQVAVDILCRGFSFLKEVGFPDDPNSFTTDPDALILPSDAGSYPLIIQYRYTVNNFGQVPESVLIEDEYLCADVAAAAGVSFTVCDVCPAGTTIVVPAGGSDFVTCTVRFDSLAAAQAFMALDDGDPRPCPPEPFKSRLGNTGPGGDPADGTASQRSGGGNGGGGGGDGPVGGDPDCYTNCATAVATPQAPADVCPNGAPLNSTGTATICLRVCELEVTKTVECLDCEPSEPNCPEDPVDSLRAAPGSTVLFNVRSRNISGAGVELCELTITDTLSVAAGTVPDCIVPDLGSVQFSIIDAGGGTIMTCPTPAGFNLNGVPFTFDINACLGRGLAPGESVVYTFEATIADGADPACDPTNTAVVEGSIDSGAECPDPSCMDDDRADIDVVEPSGRCIRKEWEVTWDSNADCVPGPAVLPFSNMHDLTTIVFPADLRLEIEVENDGDVPLDVTVTDQPLIDAVNATAGVNFCPAPEPPCELGTTKTILPGGSAVWTCCIRVDTADAMRALAANDGGTDPNVFENRATATAVMIGGDTDICVPPVTDQTPIVLNNDDCGAEIIPPPPCQLTVDKQVICVDCNDPASDQGALGDTLDALPGSCARFEIRITNTGDVRLPRLRIRDLLSPNWFIPGTVEASIGATDVTPCIAPLFGPSLSNGSRQCYTFAVCRPAAPWLEPGETLLITFAVQVPPGFGTVGDDPDLTNRVFVDGLTEVCVPNGSCTTDNSNCSDDDDSSINVLVPDIACEKTIAADYGNNGSVDFGPDDDLNLENPTFPLRLVYSFEVFNTGEVDLTNVTLCDDDLVADAVAAGADVPTCDLCDAACDGTGDECAGPFDLAAGASQVFTCELVFADATELNAFLTSDDTGNDPLCYVNTATATGTPVTTGLCVPDPVVDETSDCTARVCVNVEVECPPIVKAQFDIFNENEVRFGGTERCIFSWDERLISRYTDGLGGVTNFFLRPNLQTDFGYALIDGQRSVVVCGPDSVEAPLLGTAFRYVEVGGELDLAGYTLQGVGTQAGRIVGPGVGGGEEEFRSRPNVNSRPDDAAQAAPAVAAVTPPGGGQRGGQGPLVGSLSDKGSLLVYLKVEIKWDSSGQVVQDTFLTLTNDALQDVRVKLLLVNGDPALCNYEPVGIHLTKHQPLYWSARTGQPVGIAPFTVLDPSMGDPDDSPWAQPGDRVLRGYVLAWAVNAQGEEIHWNNLIGSATIVNFREGTALEYDPWAFKAVTTSGEGSVLLPPLGQLDLNGLEYDFAPNRLLFQFHAPGSVITSSPGPSATIVDTDLTLWAVEKSFADTQNGGQ